MDEGEVRGSWSSDACKEGYVNSGMTRQSESSRGLIITNKSRSNTRRISTSLDCFTNKIDSSRYPFYVLKEFYTVLKLRESLALRELRLY